MGVMSKSPWLLHYDASSCNGCDIEVLDCLTPNMMLSVLESSIPETLFRRIYC